MSFLEVIFLVMAILSFLGILGEKDTVVRRDALIAFILSSSATVLLSIFS